VYWKIEFKIKITCYKYDADTMGIISQINKSVFIVIRLGGLKFIVGYLDEVNVKIKMSRRNKALFFNLISLTNKIIIIIKKSTSHFILFFLNLFIF
jgi:hypothetical protein